MRHDKRVARGRSSRRQGVAQPVSKCRQRLRNSARVAPAAGKAFTKFLFRDFQVSLAFLWAVDASVPSGHKFRPTAANGTMAAGFEVHDWTDRKVREWLLLLLTFAVTREPTDHSAALAAADELDSLGVRWQRTAPRFFLRTSNEVCEAILAASDGNNNAVLRRHVARIDEPRLRRAFRAAVGLQETSDVRQEVAQNKRRKGPRLVQRPASRMKPACRPL
jgi:hypothetical protein